MNRLILFLIRKKLGVKKNECFNFSNQKFDKDMYYITDKEVVKLIKCKGYYLQEESNIKLNFLLSNDAHELINRKGVILGRLPIIK